MMLDSIVLHRTVLPKLLSQSHSYSLLQSILASFRVITPARFRCRSNNGRRTALPIPPTMDFLQTMVDTDTVPDWMYQIVAFRHHFILNYIEPLVVALFGELEHESHVDDTHRRLKLLPAYIYENTTSSSHASMKFKSFAMLFLTLSTVFMVFLSCFYHNQKTSPLFISPRRHRLPQLVPPPLPVDSFFGWIRILLLLSDEEMSNRVGYDSLVFLRFHRLALRCIVKMSVFSFIIILPLNYTSDGASDNTFSSLFMTTFIKFTMANVLPESPRLWVHCLAAYLLTAIVVRELWLEYETYNSSIRHRYLLSREPHLRTVLVTNIPRHLRSERRLTQYFAHVYPNAVRSVHLCQNVTRLEQMVRKRTLILERLESQLLHLCRYEKRKLYEQALQPTSWCAKCQAACTASWQAPWRAWATGHAQERFTHLYQMLDVSNDEIAAEQRRRQRVMRMLDTMDNGSVNDLDAVLAYQAPPLDASDRSMDRSMEMMSRSDGLRARSPVPPPDGLMKDDPPLRSKQGVSHAKQAIRQYGRFRPGNDFTEPLHDTPLMEDHINEVTDKAFVVMKTFTAATIAIQSMHSSKPGSMTVTTAPEPRDVLWENIYVRKGARRTRSVLGEILVYLIICFYVFPIAIISLLVSEKALVSSSPRLAQLRQASALFAAGIQMVQPLCIVAMQQMQPPLFMFIGRLEGITSFSEVQMRAFSRYFFFQVLNVFLVTTIAGTIFDTVAEIVENPSKAFERLGYSLPHMSSFFMTFVTIKTFIGIGVELVRLMALVQASVRFALFPTATLRRRRTTFLSMRSIDDPGWFPFHKILAQDMLVVVISVVFAVVAPLVLLPCALFCLFSRVMWTHHHLYVYESVFETGGLFWPKIFRRFIFGLVIAQMTITGQFILKGARHEAYATLFLIVLTYFFLRSTRSRFDATSSALPLEVATVMDLSLRHEEDAAQSPRQPNDPGSFIGPHDPFRQAYTQPALRAAAKARPEQPFPAAQLGNLASDKEPSSSMTSDTEPDTGATVRLKTMNQQDRHLINRWWEDQLQQAGDQNWLKILSGEDDGTLTISGPSRLDSVAGTMSRDDHCLV